MQKEQLYARVERDIANLERPTIIGINGAVTSGKTTLTHDLNQYLENKGYHTQIIHVDDFHNPRRVRMVNDSPEHYVNNAIDIPKLSELILEIKRTPVNRSMTLLNMGTDTYTDNKTFITTMDTIVIIEGVLLYSQSLTHLFDYKIYLDVDYENVLQRGKERDVPLYGEAILQQYIDFFIPVQKIYENRSLPKEQSDLLVNNDDFMNPVIVERIV